MANELSGLNILVTKPDDAGFALCSVLKKMGANAIHFPTIAFNDLQNSQRFKLTLLEVSKQNWLIFTSKKAVSAGLPPILAAFSPLPASLQFAAIGEETAKALAKFKIDAIYPKLNWSSEGLLNLPTFQAIQNQTVMLVKGAGGREFLQQELIKRGAKVTELIAYERILPQEDTSLYQQMFLAAQIDIILCTSFENVKNLKEMLGLKAWPKVQATPLIVVSERIKALAARLGFQTIWVARSPSQTDLLALLVEKKEALCQKKSPK